MYYWTVDLNRVPGGHYPIDVAVGQEVYSIRLFNNIKDYLTADMCVFNTVSLRWTKLPPVTIALENVLSVLPDTALLIDGIVYISGCLAKNGQLHFMLFAFNLESRKLFKPEVSGNGPEGTSCSRTAACVSGRVMYVFLTESGRGEIYKLDTTTMVWSLINAGGTPPSPSGTGGRKDFANIIGTKMFVVGQGQLHGKPSLYMSAFDTETNCWLSSPCALSSSTDTFTQYQCVVAYNGELYMFVARPPQPLTIDLWKLNPVTFSWKRIQAKGKGPHTHFGMQCCVVGDQIVVFDGKLHILDMNTSLKTLCKLSVIQYDLEKSELPLQIRFELEAMKPFVCPCGNSVGKWSSVHVHPNGRY